MADVFLVVAVVEAITALAFMAVYRGSLRNWGAIALWTCGVTNFCEALIRTRAVIVNPAAVAANGWFTLMSVAGIGMLRSIVILAIYLSLRTRD